MKKHFIIAFCLFSFSLFSQGYEIILYNASINEYDVFGEETYEQNNRNKQDITEKVQTVAFTTVKADPLSPDNFEPKNLLDGNMKTAWMSTNDGKNEKIELIVDLEEVENVKTAQLYYIYFFNGWRKDYQTWKDYSRIKKVSMMVNDLPYAEIMFEDSYKLQSIDLDDFMIDRSRRSRIKFSIVETYPGAKFSNVALSDIQLVGKAK